MVREGRNDIFDQIRPDRQSMAGIGRFWLVFRAFLHQAESLHDALDFLFIHLPPSSLQLLGYFAMAVEGKLFKNRLDRDRVSNNRCRFLLPAPGSTWERGRSPPCTRSWAFRMF